MLAGSKPTQNMDRNHIIAAADTLFLVMNPPGNAAVVKGLLQQLPEKRRTRVQVRELCFMLLLLLFFFFLGLSRKLLDFLGEKGTTAITRLMGTLLILLAVQMVLNGITAYLKSQPEVLR